MKEMQVSAQLGKDGADGSCEVTIDFGENVKELLTQYGEDVIYAHAKASIVVALQGYLRSKMGSEKNPIKDPKELQKLATEWKPGVRQPGKPAAEKVKETFSKMSPEERKALLASLQAEQKADQANVKAAGGGRR